MSALSFESALHLIKVGGRPAAARRSRWSKVASDVIERSDKLKQLAHDELEVRGREVRWRAKAGEPLDQLLPDLSLIHI